MAEEVGGQRSEAGGRRRIVAAVWRVVRPVLIAYLVVVLLMTFLETWLVYPVPPVEFGDWHPVGLEHEEIHFAADDGTRLYGWFVPHRQPKRVLLYCHGNGEDVARNADLVAHLRETLGASVFIFDYRGYGHSAGRPDEPGCIADGLAAQRWLAERAGVAPGDIVVMGRSLGAAVAIAIGAGQGAQALVLENAFSRMTDVAAFHYPWLPVRRLMRNRYDSLARIAQFRGPVLQSHGTADEIVPLELARELFDAIPTHCKQFLKFPGLGHNDPPPDRYYRQLAEFLDAVAAPGQADETGQAR
jgi:hypothetical protein